MDPLDDPHFRRPGPVEKLAEAFLGARRPFDCLQIEVTSACMGRCVYCPHAAQGSQWHSRHMQDQVFANLWPLLRRATRAHLQGWGEPLLHRRFFDFQALAARAGCQTSTTSCGMIMDEALAEKLTASGMDIMAFSLVGCDAESNAARAGVPFERTCRSIKMLRRAIGQSRNKQPLKIHIAYLMLADRMEAAAHLPELMDNLDVEMAVVSTLDYLAVPEHAALAVRPADTEKIAKAREILTLAAAKAEKSGRIIHFALPGQKQAEAGCRENIGRSLYIAANGDISPCVYLNVPGSYPREKRRIFGNILRDDPIAAWKSSAYAAFRTSLLSGRPDPICENCPKLREQNG